MPLLKYMHVSHVISIFGSILNERRMIFVSSSFSRLSSSMYAALSALYPFTWEVYLLFSSNC